MTLKYEVKTQETIETINRTLDSGVSRISVLIRHSDRYFSKEIQPEAFMGLTEQGKDFAFDFGLQLRSNPVPRLCSSFIGRCIETAYLIDKGYTKQNKIQLDHNGIDDILGPLFIKDVPKTLDLVRKQQTNPFLRNWFDKKIDENIIEDPEKTSDNLCDFMIRQIKTLNDKQISLCISHDWSIFCVKEFKLNLRHETAGDVGYLDGVIFFEKNGNYYITSYQADPVLL